MRRVVITGIGVVSPIGSGKNKFFESLASGNSGISRITVFDASSFPVQIAGEVKDLNFNECELEYPAVNGIKDRKVFFGLSAFIEARKDAQLSDEILQNKRTTLNLGVSLEVLGIEDIGPSVLKGKVDFKHFHNNVVKSGKSLQIPLDFTNRTIIKKHKMVGTNFINCSACAASAQTIGHSFRMIQRGEIDIALCGGMDSMINPLGVGGFGLLGALSMRNDLEKCACRPFDAKRDGTVLGEGAGILVLEEMNLALKRNVHIYGEIVGFGSSLDAYKPTDPDPDGNGAALAMRTAIHSAGLQEHQISYINAHGTATPKNDEIETVAIKKVFGQNAYSIPVSSTKSMIGHLIAASGAVECIASLSAFENNLIPPTINYSTKDYFCDLDYVPNKAREWGGDYILTNSFGFGGQNASLILKRWQNHES
jgi:3-oxoacyl-[acyl-carrier-protein] synthase II